MIGFEYSIYYHSVNQKINLVLLFLFRNCFPILKHKCSLLHPLLRIWSAGAILDRLAGRLGYCRIARGIVPQN
jgi:hypothetical protein